jgi:peptidoglycan hydrolase CwlO-like protein
MGEEELYAYIKIILNDIKKFDTTLKEMNEKDTEFMMDISEIKKDIKIITNIIDKIENKPTTFRDEFIKWIEFIAVFGSIAYVIIKSGVLI